MIILLKYKIFLKKSGVISFLVCFSFLPSVFLIEDNLTDLQQVKIKAEVVMAFLEQISSEYQIEIDDLVDGIETISLDENKSEANKIA